MKPSGLSLPLHPVFLSIGFIPRQLMAAPLALGSYPTTFKTSGKKVSFFPLFFNSSDKKSPTTECDWF